MEEAQLKLSVVSPVYNAERILPILVERIEKSLSTFTGNYEIILVEDCGPDNSWDVISAICAKNNKVLGLKLSKNFGQHYAITAGLNVARGEWVVVMDCDLQDRPEEIINLYNEAQKGYDIVLAARVNRKDSLLKKLYSYIFYKFLSYLTGIKYDERIANFGLYKRSVINAVLSMKDKIRVFPVMVKWVGFKTKIIEVKHDNRLEGKSSYNFKKLVNLSIDIVLAYSDKPIRIFIKLGVLFSFLAFLFAIITMVRYFFGYITVSGYASLIISIWFFSGLIISILGVIGLYIGKIFEGVKDRPLYIIERTTND